MSTVNDFALAYDAELYFAAREGKLFVQQSVGTDLTPAATDDLIRLAVVTGSDETVIRNPTTDFVALTGNNVVLDNSLERANFFDFTDARGTGFTYNAGKVGGGIVVAEKTGATFNDTGSGTFGFVAAGNATVNAALSTGRLAIDAGTGSNTVTLGSGAAYVRSEGDDVIRAGSGTVQVDASGPGMRFIGHVNATATVNAGIAPTTTFGQAGGTIHYTAGGGDQSVLTSDGGTEKLDGSKSVGGFAGFVSNHVTGTTTIMAGSGNTTLVAGLGTQTLVGGSGYDTFVLAANGTQGAASITISDFTTRDTVGLYGYGANEVATALKTATMSGGNTTIILGDKTSVTFMNTTSLNAHQFVGDK